MGEVLRAGATETAKIFVQTRWRSVRWKGAISVEGNGAMPQMATDRAQRGEETGEAGRGDRLYAPGSTFTSREPRWARSACWRCGLEHLWGR